MNLENSRLHRITFSLAIIGLLVTIAGNFYSVSVDKKLCYLIGTLFLMVPAILEKNTFFSILETILMIGAITAFFPISLIWKSSILISLGILTAIYFGISGQLKDYLTWLSMAGIVIGTWGYAITTPIIYFSAGTIITTYSFYSFRRGETIALVFGILNSVFALTALLEVLKILK
jgi:hypothetical protein